MVNLRIMNWIYKSFIGFLLIVLVFWNCSCSKNDQEDPVPGSVEVVAVNVGTQQLSLNSENKDLPVDQPIVIRFKTSVDPATVQASVRLLGPDSNPVSVIFSLFDSNKTVSLGLQGELAENAVYHLMITDQLKGSQQESFNGLSVEFRTMLKPLTLQSLRFDEQIYYPGVKIQEVELKPEIRLVFSHAVAAEQIREHIKIVSGDEIQAFTVSAASENKEFTIIPVEALVGLSRYNLIIDENLASESGNRFAGLQTLFYTKADLTPKFPVVSDDELLTLVQRQTFKYFWDFGHPVSGLARERNTSGEIVTSGGSGFGLMAVLVGIERGFVSRTEGIARLQKIIDFLAQADRFHGAWPHWLNGTTGKVHPFSTYDDGGDLVETSFLVAGLLAVRQYLDASVAAEHTLIEKINALWQGVEWNWYTRDGQKVLYWHWSPNYGWTMNHQIKGYNEALITYVLAASSPTYPVSADVYHEGWAGNGSIANGKSFYGINLPLGQDYGGPLFFAHYSFLGLNPNGLSDRYASYLTQNVDHSLINRAWCVENVNKYVGYSSSCWGLTASDGNQGYYAHSPSADRGVIAPTAAISSFPYMPEESLEALKFFYYVLGDRLWGDYGFYDAFNLTEGWIADSYIAIDQGPIIVMIENYRSGLIWNLFMSAPEVKSGLARLGFNTQ